MIRGANPIITNIPAHTGIMISFPMAGTAPSAESYLNAMSVVRIARREGAVWFTSTDLGDSKDNVLIRSDGQPTYYATDIAYHYDKFIRRGFDRVIDVEKLRKNAPSLSEKTP